MLLQKNTSTLYKPSVYTIGIRAIFHPCKKATKKGTKRNPIHFHIDSFDSWWTGLYNVYSRNEIGNSNGVKKIK